jgi:hypothetical protein
MVTLVFIAWFTMASLLAPPMMSLVAVVGVDAFLLAALKVMLVMAGIYAGLMMSVAVAKFYDDNSENF